MAKNNHTKDHQKKAKTQKDGIDKYKVMKLYTKSNYRVLGRHKHSAIKPCHWQEQKLLTGRENRNCYKSYFGIGSHLCLQNTPSLPFCNHQCVFCWRDIEHASFGPTWRGPVDRPKILVQKMLKHTHNIIFRHLTKERSLINLEIMKAILNYALEKDQGKGEFGFKITKDLLLEEMDYSSSKMARALLLLRNMDVLDYSGMSVYYIHPRIRDELTTKKDVDRIISRDVTTKEDIERVFEEAKHPKHAAISLAGEPTLYPRIGELVEEFRKRDMSTFIVSNGTNPDVIRKLQEDNQLPTQLYITLPASNQKLYLRVCRPLIKNGWERLMETLSLLPDLDCRTVVRITAVKYINMNLDLVPEYVNILKKYTPHFIDIKGFTVEANAVNMAKRWGGDHDLRDYRPTYDEILEFARALESQGDFEILDGSETSVNLLLRGTWPEGKSLEIDYSNV